MSEKKILIGLNEINFEYIEKYIEMGHLPNFKNIFNTYSYTQTISENKYQLLEPWIQWVTIHTGKTYDEHQIFRLGDITEHPTLKQLWNIAEEKGLKVGAISPFNARNDLKNPLFFIPDPWTKTPASGSELIKKLAEAASQSVNDNANSKLSLSSVLTILKSFLSYVPIKNWFSYVKLATKITKPGTKAIIFDKILGDVFINQWNKTTPDFSSLFLNSGAHIQHHYMFNSKVYDGQLRNPAWYCPEGYDPLLEVLKQYDCILGDILKLSNTRLFIATGLHQKAHKHSTYYWRIKDHVNTMKSLGVTKFKEALPRMSRDFLLTFDNIEEANEAATLLSSFISSTDNKLIFEVDNRGLSLFIELIYDNDIDENLSIMSPLNNVSIKLKPLVSFVAIKNGEHDGIGYFIDSATTLKKSDSIQLAEVFNVITKSF
jgi:hypothetical protein